MIFAQPLPWWMVIGLLLGAAALARLAYVRTAVPLTGRQRVLLSGLRFSTLVLLLACWLRPMALLPSAGLRDAVVPILVDGSRSMRLADADGRRRIDRVAELLQGQVLPELAGEFRVEPLSFGEAVGPADLERLPSDARRSDLAGALEAVRERYRGQTVAGLVVVSDGGDTGSLDAAGIVDPGDAPIYTVGVGARRIARDREVLSVTAGEAALTETVIELTTSVVSHGFDREPIEIRVLENGRPIQVRHVAPAREGTPVREVFQVAPAHDTATLYTVEIPADPSELAPENNTRRLLVRPPGRRRRVLLVQGAPGYEHSFLTRALAADSGIELDSIVRKGQNDRGEATFYLQGDKERTVALAGGYPVGREALFAYDAMLLANIEADFFTDDQLRMTADFVATRGGGLLVLGARSFERQGLARTPLEEVLPVALSERGEGVARVSASARAEINKLSVTAEGEGHPVMQLGTSPEDSRRRWAAAPALAATFPLGAPRPGASVLAIAAAPGGRARPLVAVQRYGRGRSMVFSGESAWRWRMMLPSSDRTYETFWRQATRWLSTAAPAPVAISASGGAVPGEGVTVDVMVRDGEFVPVADATVELRLTVPGGIEQTLQATPGEAVSGRYRVETRAEVAGVYHVQAEARRGNVVLGTDEDWVLVGGADPELADPRRNEEVLRRVAAASGGRYLLPDELGGLPDLLRRRAPERAPPGRRDLWNNVWIFGLVVALLALEWGLRRRVGLR